ncbi:MAG: glycosyltransferase, partial [Pseudomonadota bacterium]
MNQVSVHPPAPAAPRVSVVIPCFNQGRYLDEAIQSAIQQTGVQPEVIVVDDASTDATARIASSHPQVRLVRLSRNGGLANARNAGLGIATGEFVVFLDADDYLRPGALAAGVGCLIAEPDAGLAFGRYVRVNDHGAVIDSPEPIDIHEDAYSALLARNFVEMIATVTFRTEAIEQAGGLDRSLRACEDYDLLLRIARTKRVLQHNTTAACYRMHDRNMSSNNALMLRTSIRALRKQRS